MTGTLCRTFHAQTMTHVQVAYLQHAVEELIVRLLSQLVEQCSVCCFVVYLINS